MSSSNSVTFGQCPDPLRETAKRAVREAELFEVPHGILEVSAARAAPAGGAEYYARRVVERKLAGVICAISQRGKR
jgi:hypothetical protein